MRAFDVRASALRLSLKFALRCAAACLVAASAGAALAQSENAPCS